MLSSEDTSFSKHQLTVLHHTGGRGDCSFYTLRNGIQKDSDSLPKVTREDSCWLGAEAWVLPPVWSTKTSLALDQLRWGKNTHALTILFWNWNDIRDTARVRSSGSRLNSFPDILPHCFGPVHCHLHWTLCDWKNIFLKAKRSSY